MYEKYFQNTNVFVLTLVEYLLLGWYSLFAQNILYDIPFAHIFKIFVYTVLNYT